MARYNPAGDLADLEAELRERGFEIYCGPSLFAACVRRHSHSAASLHYRPPGRAIDVGVPGPAVSTLERSTLDRLTAELDRRGFRCRWNADPAHKDHAHIDNDEPYPPAIVPTGAKHSGAAAYFGQAPRFRFGTRRGRRGELVRLVQQRVEYFDRVAVDGAFGPATEAAVKLWQSALGVEVDGKVGPRTIRADLRHAGTVRLGSRGAPVRWVQLAVRAEPDGVFGPETEAAVKRAQAEWKLTPDGVFGAASRSGLIR